jgi:hypothetical protein
MSYLHHPATPVAETQNNALRAFLDVNPNIDGAMEIYEFLGRYLRDGIHRRDVPPPPPLEGVEISSRI